jgi:hypothetical protein
MFSGHRNPARAGTGREIDAAFANLVQKSGGALLVGPDAFFWRAQIVTLAARHALPAMVVSRIFRSAPGDRQRAVGASPIR